LHSEHVDFNIPRQILSERRVPNHSRPWHRSSPHSQDSSRCPTRLETLGQIRRSRHIVALWAAQMAQGDPSQQVARSAGAGRARTGDAHWRCAPPALPALPQHSGGRADDASAPLARCLCVGERRDCGRGNSVGEERLDGHWSGGKRDWWWWWCHLVYITILHVTLYIVLKHRRIHGRYRFCRVRRKEEAWPQWMVVRSIDGYIDGIEG
jgi:hypothetical protein